MFGKQLAQMVFRLGKAAPAHIDVGQPYNRVGRLRVERERLLVFLLGVGESIFSFQKLAPRKMRLGLFGLESRRLLVIGKGLFGL